MTPSVSRRALLGAGALLVAGCGAPEAVPVDSVDVLNHALLQLQVAELAYGDEPGRAGAARRSAKLEAAVRALGGTPQRAPASGPRGTRAALDAERAALRSQVAAVGKLPDAKSRALLASLIAETAAAEARLAKGSTSFPGQPLSPKA